MKRLSKRARRPLALALGLAVIASVAGLAAYRQLGSQAHAAAAPASSAAPGSVQSQADLGRMQALLNSGSVSEQAALLVPGFRFAPGSKPVFPAGTKVAIEQATFRPSGRFATVTARVSGSPVTLGLYVAGGHWRLYAVRPGAAQTRAAVTRPAAAELTASMTTGTVKTCPRDTADIGNKVPVVFIHGFWGSASDWGPDAPGSMFYAADQITGTWTSAFDYSQYNGEWVDNPAIGKRFVDYLDCVAAASRAGHGPGKVIVIAHSMGGLVTRWAASNGAGDSIAEVITLGTPNTGAAGAGFGDAVRQLFCDTQSMLNYSPDTGSFCTEFTALSGMDAYGGQIASLPELPSSIPLYAIAGDETVQDPLGGAVYQLPSGSDMLVDVPSALHQPPGGGQFTPVTITCSSWHPRGPCWHGALPGNAIAQADVRNWVQAYVRAHYGPQAPAQGQQPLAGHPAGPDGNDPLNVIYNYYDYLNAHQYQQAWDLGGSNIAGTSYDNWVAGYANTKGLYITGQDAGTGLGNHIVQVSITATQDDGSVQYYAGTYTVREINNESWTILAAAIREVSGPAPAAQLGGLSYWLNDGGQWYVHGMQLQITRDSQGGLTGTETWNAGGNIFMGTAHLSFTSNADGSLTGTYTDDGAITQTGQANPYGTQPDPSVPKKGDVIRLVPVAPMHAQTIAVSPPAPAFGGNTNLCQPGLPDPSQYCGA
jgi:pimeloyl-ACP methyl ester carboxylesterase